MAREVAICEPCPPLPPRADDFALLAEGARLSLGEALPLDRTKGNQNVRVKVFAVAVPVSGMDRPVCNEALSGESFADKIPHQKDLLAEGHLVGQGQFKAMGQLGGFVPRAAILDKLKTVPKLGANRHPRGGMLWGVDFCMQDAHFAAVVIAISGFFIGQRVAGTIGRRRDDAFAFRPPFDLMVQIENRHELPLPEAGAHYPLDV